jgi:hypothetical protein
MIRMNNASAAAITGLKAGSDGQLVTIISVGTGVVGLAHQNASSNAANRFLNNATSANTPLAAGAGSALYQYDTTTERWRLVFHNQGAWITASFAAGDYTGTNSMTWTLTSGDVISQQYFLSGRSLSVMWGLSGTSVGGTPDIGLKISNAQWGGFVAEKQALWPAFNQDAGANAIGYAFVFASGTAIEIRRADNGNWTAFANGTATYGSTSFGVT